MKKIAGTPAPNLDGIDDVVCGLRLGGWKEGEVEDLSLDRPRVSAAHIPEPRYASYLIHICGRSEHLMEDTCRERAQVEAATNRALRTARKATLFTTQCK